MKTIYTVLTLALFTGFTVLASTNNSNPSTLSTGSTTPEDLCGKTLKVVSHTDNGQAMSHANDDYVKLLCDGTYIQYFNGVRTEGTWAYDAGAGTLSVDARHDYVWSVNNCTSTTLDLSTKQYTLSLKVKISKKVMPKTNRTK